MVCPEWDAVQNFGVIIVTKSTLSESLVLSLLQMMNPSDLNILLANHLRFQNNPTIHFFWNRCDWHVVVLHEMPFRLNFINLRLKIIIRINRALLKIKGVLINLLPDFCSYNVFEGLHLGPFHGCWIHIIMNIERNDFH